MVDEKRLGMDDPRVPPRRRLYSMLVIGWERSRDGAPHEHIGECRARVVADGPTAAIALARAALGDGGELQHWAVIEASELAPGESAQWGAYLAGLAQ